MHGASVYHCVRSACHYTAEKALPFKKFIENRLSVRPDS